MLSIIINSKSNYIGCNNAFNICNIGSCKGAAGSWQPKLNSHAREATLRRLESLLGSHAAAQGIDLTAGTRNIF